MIRRAVFAAAKKACALRIDFKPQIVAVRPAPRRELSELGLL
jgi:hypothetical protein